MKKFIFPNVARLFILSLVSVSLGTVTASAATTSTLLPNGQGTYTAWANGESTIDEGTASPSCSSSDAIDTSSTGDRESVLIALSSIPNGSTITSVSISVVDRGDSSSGGTYQTFTRLNSTDQSSGINLSGTGGSGDPCSSVKTQSIDVTDTVKSATTTLEIGVIKTSTNTTHVRVGAITAVVTYTVVATNTAPVLTAIGNKTVNELSLLTFTATSTDADGPSATYSLTGTVPTGASIDSTTGVFTWTPTEAQGPGSYTFSVQVSDGALTDSKSVTVTVNEVNTAPVLNSIGAKSVDENTNLSFTIGGSDVDLPANTLTYSASNLPSGATFNTTTKTFSWTPSYSQSGSYPSVHFQVNDGTTTTSENITITVNNVNRAPTLSAIGNKTVNENSLLSFSISGTDPDGETLTYSASNLPTGATFNPTTKTFSWTPSYSQSGSYPTVHFQVTDGAATASEDITITVNNVNRAPTLNTIGNKTVNENSELSFSVSGTDPDGDTTTFTATNLPTGATFDGTTFSWTPDFTQAGNYSVTFKVSDGSLFATEVVPIDVGNVNRTPVLAAIGNRTGESAVPEEATTTFTASATDPDSDAVTYSLTGDVPTGASIDSTTGVFTWIPTEAQGSGSYTFTVQASDGTLIDTEEITIEVKEVNISPIAVNQGVLSPGECEGECPSVIVDGFVTDEDTTATTTLVATDVDLPAQDITYRVDTNPTHGTVTIVDNKAVYTPSLNYNGTDSFTFIANDGVADSNTATVLITVNSVNDLPVIQLLGVNPEYYTVNYNRIESGATSTDVEDGDLTDEISLSGDFDISTVGVYTLKYSVTDSGGLTASTTRTVHVLPQSGGAGGANGKVGCMDSAAINYDPTAGYSSGDCQYSGTGEVLGVSTSTETGGAAATSTTETTGQVLGASASCKDAGPYLTKFLRSGYKNDIDSVKKLQTFLNSHLGTKIPITGFFGKETRMAVRKLQALYKDKSLAPWNLADTTGIVYITTRSIINNIVCSDFPVETPTNPVPFDKNPESPKK